MQLKHTDLTFFLRWSASYDMWKYASLYFANLIGKLYCRRCMWRMCLLIESRICHAARQYVLRSVKRAELNVADAPSCQIIASSRILQEARSVQKYVRITAGESHSWLTNEIQGAAQSVSPATARVHLNYLSLLLRAQLFSSSLFRSPRDSSTTRSTHHLVCAAET